MVNDYFKIRRNSAYLADMATREWLATNALLLIVYLSILIICMYVTGTLRWPPYPIAALKMAASESRDFDLVKNSTKPSHPHHLLEELQTMIVVDG